MAPVPELLLCVNVLWCHVGSVLKKRLVSVDLSASLRVLQGKPAALVAGFRAHYP